MAHSCLDFHPPSSVPPVEELPFPIVSARVPWLIPIGPAWITHPSFIQSRCPEGWGALIGQARVPCLLLTRGGGVSPLEQLVLKEGEAVTRRRGLDVGKKGSCLSLGGASSIVLG